MKFLLALAPTFLMAFVATESSGKGGFDPSPRLNQSSDNQSSYYYSQPANDNQPSYDSEGYNYNYYENPEN
jgi:hypothetical protein